MLRAYAAQGGSAQDWFNMQAMARALSDDSYGPPAGLVSRVSADGSLDSRGHSHGGSAYGSFHSEGPVVGSPFTMVSSHQELKQLPMHHSAQEVAVLPNTRSPPYLTATSSASTFQYDGCPRQRVKIC